MLEYELSQLLHTVVPYLLAMFFILVGIWIANSFWKPRIYRYAKSEILKTLEYQKNKIDQLEKEISRLKEIIAEYRANQAVAKASALRIMGAMK